MTKFYSLSKTDFEFCILNQSVEFFESFDCVFIKNNKMYLVFKKTLIHKNVKNIKGHVIEFYKNEGFKKIIFLNHG